MVTTPQRKDAPPESGWSVWLVMGGEGSSKGRTSRNPLFLKFAPKPRRTAIPSLLGGLGAAAGLGEGSSVHSHEGEGLNSTDIRRNHQVVCLVDTVMVMSVRQIVKLMVLFGILSHARAVLIVNYSQHHVKMDQLNHCRLIVLLVVYAVELQQISTSSPRLCWWNHIPSSRMKAGAAQAHMNA